MTKRSGKVRLNFFSKLRKLPYGVAIFALLVSSIIVPLMPAGDTHAISSSDLTLYDAKTNHRRVTDEHKTVTITAYIAGPNSSSGTLPELDESNIRVFGTNDLSSGEYNFQVLWVSPIAVADDPHNGMYEVRAFGRPQYKGSSPFMYDISFCALLEGETTAHCATQGFSASSSVNPSGVTVSFGTAQTNVVTLGYDDPDAEEDDTEKTCRTENGIIGFFVCSVADLLGNAVSGIYEAFIVDRLNIDPKLFSRDPNITGDLVYATWARIRNIANVALVIGLLVMIISQITGAGLSNYNIKKMLPKLLMGAVVINFSYYICQAAIDLSNIVGNGIAGFMENISSELTIPDPKGSGKVLAGTLLTLVSGIAILVMSGVTALGMVLLIIGVLLAGILAIFVLAITLGIRQAATIVLVIVSPLMVICYSIDGLKPIYKRWFKMFQAMLIAYPMASFVVYGSSLGAKILLIGQGTTSTFGTIGAFGLAVVPFFLLPKMITKSMGSLSTITTRLQNNIKGGAQRMYNQSGLKKYEGYRREQKRLDRLAGIRVTKDGKVKKRLFSTPFGLGDKAEFMEQAMRHRAANEQHKLFSEDEKYFGNRQFAQKVSDLKKDIGTMKLSPDALMQRMDSLATSMDNVDTSQDQIRDGQAMMAALAGTLATTSEGRKQLDKFMRDARFNGLTRTEGAHAVVRAVAQGVDNKDLGAMMHDTPYLGGFLQAVRNDSYAAGNYNDFNMTTAMLQQLGAEDWGKLSAEDRARMIADANNDPNSAAAAAFNHFMEEVCNNQKLGNSANPEAAQTSSDSHIADAQAYVDARTQGIVNAAAALEAQGNATEPNFGFYTVDKSYYMKAFEQAAQSGDLAGMEAAHLALQERANQELQGYTGGAAEKFAKDYADEVDKMFSTVIGTQFSVNNGVDRSAVVQQVALLRARAQGKNN